MEILHFHGAPAGFLVRKVPKIAGFSLLKEK